MILSDRFSYPDGYEERCEELLDMAFERVPLYRKWKQYDPGPEASADERFNALPVLTKADMRSNFPTGLMPDGMSLEDGLKNGDVEYTFTSGTTSEKVVNIWNQDWWDRSEHASWKLNETLKELKYPAERQAKLASALNVGISCEEDLPMDHRIMGNTLYLNEKINLIQWQERHLKRMAQELNSFEPVIIEANPSLLARLCWWAADNGVYIKQPKAVVFTFEFPSGLHLKAIRQVFPDTAFVSSYGSTETGFVMEQCKVTGGSDERSGSLMHQNTDFCRIDFMPLKEEYGDPDLGRIVVSTFGNPWNCILRFDVGDIIRLHRDNKCACGNSEGMIADAVEGRVGNITFDLQGRIVTTRMLDEKLSEAEGLRDYHLEQDTGSHYSIDVMSIQKNNQKNLKESLYNLLGNVYGYGGEYDIRFCDDILPGPAGKFRRTQANFEFDERGFFR